MDYYDNLDETHHKKRNDSDSEEVEDDFKSDSEDEMDDFDWQNENIVFLHNWIKKNGLNELYKNEYIRGVMEERLFNMYMENISPKIIEKYDNLKEFCKEQDIEIIKGDSKEQYFGMLIDNIFYRHVNNVNNYDLGFLYQYPEFIQPFKNEIENLEKQKIEKNEEERKEYFKNANNKKKW